jgi:NAD(P)H-quinone oxidoreductase subunit 3
MDPFSDFKLLGGFLVLGGLIAIIPVVVPLLIAPRFRGLKTTDTYECGVDTIGPSWIRFSVAFYLFALIFVAFEVDVLYLFPVTLVYGTGQFAGGWRDFIEVGIFISILSLAIVFAWRKGVFEWD